MLMMHLSRLSEEIILWCSQEFRFIELDDTYATGSEHDAAEEKPRHGGADPR
nr:lyase family protein [Bacillus velezensis]